MKISTIISYVCTFSCLAFSVSSCSHNANESNRVEKTRSAELSKRYKYVGTWKITTEDNQIYYITLKEDGTASSTNGKGENGTWKMSGKRAVISFNNGYQNIIFKQGKQYTKWGFAPGSSIHTEPSNKQLAEKEKNS